MWIVALGVAVLMLVLSGMFASAVLVGLALQESHDLSDVDLSAPAKVPGAVRVPVKAGQWATSRQVAMISK